MSILKPITEKKAKGKVKKIYEDIKSKRKITKIVVNIVFALIQKELKKKA